MRTHADALLKGEGVAIFHPRIDHWPQITGLFHLPIAVIELVEQRLAGHFKVAKIVTVPGHAHHIDVVKGNGQLDFSGKSGIVKHPLLLVLNFRQLPEIEKIKPVEGRLERVMFQTRGVVVDSVLQRLLAFATRQQQRVGKGFAVNMQLAVLA
ncbi:hypothetical protein ESCO106056_25085 [Escherichia coli]